jgi:hypothetical protein
MGKRMSAVNSFKTFCKLQLFSDLESSGSLKCDGRYYES